MILLTNLYANEEKNLNMKKATKRWNIICMYARNYPLLDVKFWQFPPLFFYISIAIVLWLSTKVLPVRFSISNYFVLQEFFEGALIHWPISEERLLLISWDFDFSIICFMRICSDYFIICCGRHNKSFNGTFFA